MRAGLFALFLLGAVSLQAQSVRPVVLVIVTLPDASTPAITAAEAQALFGQVAQFYAASSRQAQRFTGTVAGPLALAVPLTGCTSDELQHIVEAGHVALPAADPQAVYVWVFPAHPACPWGGSAVTGGQDVWINGTPTRAILVHELGHILGLLHAHARQCVTAIEPPCQTYEYGDWFDPLGGDMADLNSFHQQQLGWPMVITPALGSGTYPLNALTGASDGPRALQIPNGDGTAYYVEYRPPGGNDLFMTTQMNVPNLHDGVILHQATPGDPNSSLLLDLTPGSPQAFQDPALVTGASFLDRRNGLRVTTVSATGTSALVRIERGLPGRLTLLVSLPGTIPVGAPLLIQATVTVQGQPVAGVPVACQIIDDVAGPQPLPAGVTDATGRAVLTWQPTKAGIYQIAAQTRSGDVWAATPALSLTVTP